MPKLRLSLQPVGAALALLGLCVAGPAWAADPKQDSKAEPCGAEQHDPGKLAEAGLRLYQDAVRNLAPKDPQGAVRQFEIALRCYRGVERYSKDPAKIYHPMGLVYQRLGRYTEALDAFKRFLAEVPEDQRKPGVTKQIQDRLAELRQHVAELAVDTVPGLDVRVDDRPLGRSPLPRAVPVAPGAHTVIVGDPERGTLGADVTVKAGEVRRVDLTAWKPRETRPPVAQEPGGTGGQAQEAPARLSVRANRDGAEVRFDGRLLGQTPLAAQAVPAGEHRLKATAGSAELSQVLSLRPGEDRQVELTFPPRVKPWVIAVSVVAGVVVVGAAVGLGVYFGTSGGGPDRTLTF